MDTIFAPITSAFNSGVSVIRISGSEVKNCLQKLGVKKNLNHQEISFHKIYNPQNNQILDECLIAFFKGPQSFTGQDVAEISIHGSPFILRKVLEILSAQKNCRIAQNGEFSKRAFLNGKIDLIQAEAIVDLIACETESQHRQALQQLQGKLGEIYQNWREELIEISALIEAAIDFPDEDLPQNIIDGVENRAQKLIAEIKNHLSDNKIGQKIKDGLNLAIIGAPNAGKSSLLNFLAKSDVAIVCETAGTTRDVIEINLNIAGIAVKISDTAGIHETNDKIEKEGIRRALKKAEIADIKIYLIDSANPKIDENLIDEKTILIANKNDLQNFSSDSLDFLSISIKENKNCDKLIAKLEEKIKQIIPNQTSPLITNERYRVSLNKALENLENFSLTNNIELAAEDLRMAAREIGKIIGKVDVDDILDVIFSRFCIGK
jgi:tRNA modification GTPase